MRQLHYVNAQVIVCDIVCKAVLRYARALARSGTSDIVSVPVRLDTGARADAYLVLGPASQLFSTPVVEPVEEPPVREASDLEHRVARDLERRTVRLQPSRPEWSSELSSIPDLDFDF